LRRGYGLGPVRHQYSRQRNPANGGVDQLLVDQVEVTGGLIQHQQPRLFVESARQ
jgi:hypothetical protein